MRAILPNDATRASIGNRMAEEPKPTLEQVKASVRDALRKLTGGPGSNVGVEPPKEKNKPLKGPKPEAAED